MDQAFTLHFWILQVIKNWMMERPGNKASLSFYLHMYICTLREPQVLRHQNSHSLPFAHNVSRTNISESTSKSEKQTLVASSTAFAWCLTRLDLCSRGISPLQCPWLSDQHQKPKEHVYSYICQKRHLTILKPSHHACIFAVLTTNRIIISFLRVGMN